MKRKVKSTRSRLSTSLAKTMAYLEAENIELARQWAIILRDQLVEIGVLDNPAATCHNTQHRDNPTT